MSFCKLDEPLESAYASENVADVKQLLHDYEDLSMFSWKLEEPLESACASDIVADVKQLLNDYEDQTHIIIKLFYRAVANNSVGVLEFLFSLEYDFSSQDVSYYFAHGRVLPETSALFRSYGWDVDAMAAANPMKWEHMVSRIEGACESDDVEYLKENLVYEQSLSGPNPGQEGETSRVEKAMQLAVQMSIPAHALNTLRYILEQGASPTPKYFIVGPKGISLDVLEVLLAYGYNINRSSHSVLAKVAPEPDKVRWCLLHGADPSVTSPGFLNHLAQTGDTELWKLLRARGAPMDYQLLHRAARSASTSKSTKITADMRANYFKMVRHLIEEEHLDPNILDEPLPLEYRLRNPETPHGTPLHYCVQAEGPGLSVIYYLLDKGADPMTPNIDGVSALEQAKQQQCRQFVNTVHEHAMKRSFQAVNIG